MICPHCHKTIREEQRYLMSAQPRETPINFRAWPWVIPGLLILGFVITYGLFDAVARLTGG